jgi:hypothetical protein
MNQQKEGFDRLLDDLQEDDFQAELEANQAELKRKVGNVDLQFLRKKLRRRYQHQRMSPSLMYMPRLALTFAILMSCAVAFLYIKKLRENQFQSPKTPPKVNIDSLIKMRKK